MAVRIRPAVPVFEDVFHDPVVQRIQGYALRTRRSQFDSVRGLQVCSRSPVDLERRPAEAEVASSSLAESAKYVRVAQL